jgi:tripartite-type tricarboxylate transporter receptor subunit TctC
VSTPKEAVNALRDDVVRALAAPDVKQKLAAQGAEPSNFAPEEFVRFLKEDTRSSTRHRLDAAALSKIK